MRFHTKFGPEASSSSCEHFLFVYIHCKTKRKKVGGFKKNRGFFNLVENKICCRQTFEICIIPKHGTCKVTQKSWARSVQLFRRLLDKKKTDKIHRC